jgi:predicted SprT family Zn-dependent metalloprotease
MTLEEAEDLALKLMDKHYVLDFDFRFENRKSSLGRCKYGRKKIIFLSRWYVLNNPIIHIKDTILHEIAHALDFYERGTSDHGRNWKRIAREVGCTPRSCGKKTNKPNNHYRYVHTCSCGKTYRKHRLRNAYTYYCRTCGDDLYRGRPPKTPEAKKADQDLINEILGLTPTS